MKRLLGLLFILAAGPAPAREVAGVVTHVQDGDSFILRDSSGAELTVRMAEADAPEHRQPHADEARQHLRRLVEGQAVTVLTNDSDRYGRIIGRVYRDGQDINGAMVAAGYAWANLPYLTDRDFLQLEATARQARRGLWADRQKPVEPWRWREARRAAAGSAASASGQPDRDEPERGTAACRIKGNIAADGRRRYHIPGSRHYDATRIDTRRGERYFCSEAEAEAAGWRRAGGN